MQAVTCTVTYQVAIIVVVAVNNGGLLPVIFIQALSVVLNKEMEGSGSEKFSGYLHDLKRKRILWFSNYVYAGWQFNCPYAVAGIILRYNKAVNAPPFQQNNC